MIELVVAQADVVGAATPDLLPSLWRMLGALVVVLALVGGLAWLLRRGAIVRRRATGIVTGGPATIVNSGTITGTGGTAIQFTAGPAAPLTNSLTLVAGSVMFLRTLKNLQAVDLGFQPAGLVRVEQTPERLGDPRLCIRNRGRGRHCQRGVDDGGDAVDKS